jgi:hypothetical protein
MLVASSLWLRLGVADVEPILVAAEHGSSGSLTLAFGVTHHTDYFSIVSKLAFVNL